MAQKWNSKTEQYEDYNLPNGATLGVNYGLFEIEVNCANCGRFIKFGDTYTSNLIHTNLGLGYAVCPDCYEKEMEEIRKYKEERK